MNYAIISASHGPDEGRSDGEGSGQAAFRWVVSESEVSGEQLGQALKRHKNKMIVVVDADEAATMVERLNARGRPAQEEAEGRHPEQAIADAKAAGPSQPTP